MPSKDSLSEQETAQRERLSRCHDAVEEAEAHLAAEEVPEAWVDTGPEGADFDAALAASAYSLEADVAQELLRPLEAETRGRIADDVVGAYLAERDDGAPAVLPTVGSTPVPPTVGSTPVPPAVGSSPSGTPEYKPQTCGRGSTHTPPSHKLGAVQMPCAQRSPSPGSATQEGGAAATSQ